MSNEMRLCRGMKGQGCGQLKYVGQFYIGRRLICKECVRIQKNGNLTPLELIARGIDPYSDLECRVWSPAPSNGKGGAKPEIWRSDLPVIVEGDRETRLRKVETQMAQILINQEMARIRNEELYTRQGEIRQMCSQMAAQHDAILEVLSFQQRTRHAEGQNLAESLSIVAKGIVQLSDNSAWLETQFARLEISVNKMSGVGELYDA